MARPALQGALSSFRVYDRALSDAEVAAVSATDAEVHADRAQAQAQAILTALNLTDRETSGDIDLPTSNGRVTWTSSNPAVVSPSGIVAAPLAGQPAIPVTLTATASIRGISASTSIIVTVLPSTESAEQRAERLAQRFVIPSVVRSGTSLPAAPDGTTVAVTSVVGGIEVGDAITSATEQAVDAEIGVRVTDTASGVASTRQFSVRVLPALLRSCSPTTAPPRRSPRRTTPTWR